MVERKELLNLLKSVGITKVRAVYDGCGDEGQIGGIGYDKGSEESIDHQIFAKMTIKSDQPLWTHGGWSSKTHQIAICDAVPNMFYDVLEDAVGGWELDDGSFGELTWDLTTDQIKIAHNDRFTEIDHREYQA